MKWPFSIALAAMLALAPPIVSSAKTQTLALELTDPRWRTIAALHFPREVRTAFRETRSSKLLRKPAEQSGALWIEHSGDFVMQVLEPRTEERRLSGQRLQLTRSEKQRSITLDRNKGAHQLLLSIVAVLEGNVEQLQTNFELLSQDADSGDSTGEWSVILTPVDPALRKTLQRLVLSGYSTSLLSLRAERSTSRWQEIAILPATPANPEQSLRD